MENFSIQRTEEETEPAEGLVFLLSTGIFYGFSFFMSCMGIDQLPELNGVRHVLETFVLYGIWLTSLQLLFRWRKKEDPGLLGFGDVFPYEVQKLKKMNGKTVFYTLTYLCIGSVGSVLIGVFLVPGAEAETAEILYPITVVESLIIAPVFEELIFRGFLQKNLRKYGDLTAIMIAALTFAIGHGSLVNGISAFLHGLVFGYLAMYYGIKWAMAAHMAANLPLALERLFPDAAFSFVIGKNSYVFGLSQVIMSLEEAALPVLLVCFLVRLVKCRKEDFDPGPWWEDVPKMPVQFSRALSIPLSMAVLMFFLLMLQVVRQQVL